MLKILDIGSRGGATTIFPHFLCNQRFLYFLKRKTFEIIGIEPDATQKKILLEGGFYKEIYSIGLYDKNDKVKLYITKSEDCSSILYPNIKAIKKNIKKEWWPKFEVIDTVSIETKKLDTFCDELNLSFDLIKIDVQGVEFEIVKSGLKTIKDSIGVLAELSEKPWYINQKSSKEFIDLMHTNGFIKIERNFKPHIPSESDYLFVKKFDKLKNRSELIKVLLVIFMFNKKRTFVIYFIKGLFKRLLNIKDIKDLFKKRRKYFLNE